jgi:hypothetical protein
VNTNKGCSSTAKGTGGGAQRVHEPGSQSSWATRAGLLFPEFSYEQAWAGARRGEEDARGTRTGEQKANSFFVELNIPPREKHRMWRGGEGRQCQCQYGKVCLLARSLERPCMHAWSVTRSYRSHRRHARMHFQEPDEHTFPRPSSI